MSNRAKKEPTTNTRTMKTITGYIKLGNFGHKANFEFDIEDDATDEEIEEIAKDAAFDLIEWNWEEKGGEDE